MSTRKMGQHRPMDKSPRKGARRATLDRRQARAVKYSAQGRTARGSKS